MAPRKKTGLGKGLDALIGTGTITPPDTSSKPQKNTDSAAQTSSKKPAKPAAEKEKVKIVEKIVEVPVEKIVEKVVEVPVEKVVEVRAETIVNIDEIEPNMNQPRKTFDDEALQELAESIKLHGVIQPLIVVKKDDYYVIIAGERRWRAARIAGLTELPVIIKDYTPKESMEVALIENIQRQDLNPIEEAEAFKNLIEEYGLKQEEAAERVSKSRTAVTNALRLLKLDERVKQLVIDGSISSGHARTLLSLESGELQYQTAMQIFDNKLSVRDTERLIKRLLNPPKPKEEPDPQLQLIYEQIEDRLKTAIGTKVQIKPGSKKKGKIEINYYSQDELERIVSLLTSLEKAKEQ